MVVMSSHLNISTLAGFEYWQLIFYFIIFHFIAFSIISNLNKFKLSIAGNLPINLNISSLSCSFLLYNRHYSLNAVQCEKEELGRGRSAPAGKTKGCQMYDEIKSLNFIMLIFLSHMQKLAEPKLIGLGSQLMR